MPAKQPRIIAFVNQKGGVLKTTLCAQMAYAFSTFHKLRVLAIDLDPQANLTTALGMEGKEGNFSSFYVLKDRVIRGLLEINPYLFLIPSHIELARGERGFSGDVDWQHILRIVLEEKLPEAAPEGFDLILIDSPPNLGMFTVNALVAADEVIVPMNCARFAANGMVGLTETVKQLQRLNPKLIIQGIVPTIVNMHLNIDKAMIKWMQDTYKDLVFRSKIPAATSLNAAVGLGKSIWEHDPGSLAAVALRELSDEILERAKND